MIANIVLLVGGVGVLYFGAEWLVRGSARLAAALGIHAIVIGLTVVSFGTSAPELVVSLVAALEGNPDIALGNVLGSNLANIGLILGLSALVKPLMVATRVVTREVPIMLLATGFLYTLVMDRGLGRADGAVLLCFLGAYLIFMFKSGRRERPEIIDELEELVGAADATPSTRVKDVALIVVGCLALVLGGRAIVHSAQVIAEAFGISQLVIGLTVIAVGTSLPELATSVVAAVRNEADIAVGNIIGSNIFNIAAILGITASVAPLGVNPSVLTRELPAVMVMSVLAWPLVWTGFQIKRWEAAFLLTTYVVIGYWLIWGGGPGPS